MVNGEQLWNLFRGVAEGSVTPRAALNSVLQQLQQSPPLSPAGTAPVETGATGEAAPVPPNATQDVVVDLDRATRCGFPEVVYGPGKTLDDICEVWRAQAAVGQNSLATRCSPEQLAGIRSRFSEVVINPLANTARTACCTATLGRVVVVTAGTSDRPVAEEACETLRWMGVDVELLMDLGVAGPQRFLERRHMFATAAAVVVVAGMEGALPSVVGGWVDVPVIGVPTSVGYGAAFGGISALLGMLNSCAANVTVVNIDGGFKAGYLAGMIARRTTPPTAATHAAQIEPTL